MEEPDPCAAVTTLLPGGVCLDVAPLLHLAELLQTLEELGIERTKKPDHNADGLLTT